MLTSKDLLYKALDYDGFWNTSKRMTTSKPSQARKMQLEKLLATFNISKKNAKVHAHLHYKAGYGLTVKNIYLSSHRPKSMNRMEYIKTLTDFKYLSTGEFIADIDRVKYKNFLKRFVSVTKRIFPEQSELINKDTVNLVFLFSELYNFRLNLYHTFKYNFNCKRKEGFSAEDDYSLHLKKKLKESMNNNFSEVDEILCVLIDPEKKAFKEDEIDYPIYDFETLDKEWRNELHTNILPPAKTIL